MSSSSQGAPRILWLATADARGHLMRAQVLTHRLRAAGAVVDVVTTSNEGTTFLAEFGIHADVLSPHYRVEFDAAQHMARTATELRVLRYLLDPARLRRDLRWLRERADGVDLVINDSFHPALLSAPVLERKMHVVHVYGQNLRRALEQNFHQRVPGLLAQSYAGGMRLLIDQAFGCVEHSFAWRDAPSTRRHRVLPPVIAAPRRTRAQVRADLGLDENRRLAAVYLNPHFTDPSVAVALEETLLRQGAHMHAVGEGYAGRPGWRARDASFVDVVAAADLLVSAPGMGALTQARILGTPFLAIVTDQPEQAQNLGFLQGASHPVEKVILQCDRHSLHQDLATAANRLLLAPQVNRRTDVQSVIEETHALWSLTLIGFAEDARRMGSAERLHRRAS